MLPRRATRDVVSFKSPSTSGNPASAVDFRTGAKLFLFWTANMTSLAANVLCLGLTTIIVVQGASLSTRGPEGSMIRAVDGIYALRRRCFALFYVGAARDVTRPDASDG